MQFKRQHGKQQKANDSEAERRVTEVLPITLKDIQSKATINTVETGLQCCLVMCFLMAHCHPKWAGFSEAIKIMTFQLQLLAKELPMQIDILRFYFLCSASMCI